MARDDPPPFGRGETFYNGATIDPANLGGSQWEGKTWVFEDVDYTPGTAGAKPSRSGRYVKCMAVRNVSGIALLAKRLVTLQTAGTDGRFFLGRVDGYATLTAAQAYPVDEFLPAAGVPNNDMFWIVVDGPAKVLTDLAGAATNVFAVGGAIVALTAATSQATTAGRVAPQDLTGATSILGNQIQNKIGYALSARTTGNTNADLLIDVRRW
jgi:hypothetical protein